MTEKAIKKGDASELAVKIEKELPTFVSEKRLLHILSVRSTALFLCDLFASLGADIAGEKVEQAALLHDITKCMNQGEICKRYGISLSFDDENSPETLHAVTGAYFARERYGICDEVFSAIKKHTVGDLEMSLLDKIIFVSDYCEETRVHEDCRKMRECLLKMPKKISDIHERHERLDRAVLLLDLIMAEIILKTLKFLSLSGGHIHQKTYEALKALKALHKDDKELCALCARYSDVIDKISF